MRARLRCDCRNGRARRGPFHQGTTSPAATSAGSRRSAEHCVAVRKAAEALDDVVMLRREAEQIVVAERGEQQQRAILVGEILAVLERHVEEAALALARAGRRSRGRPRRLAMASARWSVANCSAWPRNMLRGNWSNRITAGERGQRIAEKMVGRQLPLLRPQVAGSARGCRRRLRGRVFHHCSGSRPNQKFEDVPRQSTVRPARVTRSPCRRPSGRRSAGSAGRRRPGPTGRPCRKCRRLRRARGRCRCP